MSVIACLAYRHTSGPCADRCHLKVCDSRFASSGPPLPAVFSFDHVGVMVVIRHESRDENQTCIYTLLSILAGEETAWTVWYMHYNPCVPWCFLFVPTGSYRSAEECPSFPEVLNWMTPGSFMTSPHIISWMTASHGACLPSAVPWRY